MTKADIYFYSWQQLIEKEIRAAVEEVRLESSDTAETAIVLGWQLSEVKKVLAQEPVNDLPGETAFQLTKENVIHRSPAQARLIVKCGIVNAVDFLHSKRAVGKFLGINDRNVRRFMGSVMEEDY